MSSGSSSSNLHGSSRTPNEFCFCGVRAAPIRMAWTKENIGRRYVGCTKYPARNACKFFYWVDLKICERGNEALWDMKKKIDAVEDEICDCRAREVELQCELTTLRERISKLQMINSQHNKENATLTTEITKVRKKMLCIKAIFGVFIMIYLMLMFFNLMNRMNKIDDMFCLPSN
ncbi:hypothetical protein M5689_007362 [Euphorbia peplus]|nr:hypothetical protein M5689_007362 [Euphorbia peplus]